MMRSVLRRREMQHNLLLFLPFFCFLLSGCRKDRPLSDIPSVSEYRTVLVYLGTDNEFRPEAAQKIEQLKSNWSRTVDGNLLVYADTGENPVLVHIYHTERRGNVADTIETYLPENSANPATFARVLDKVRSYRPAASYGLVVLSHATGWLPAEMSYPAIRLKSAGSLPAGEGEGRSTKSIIQDKSTNESDNYLELSDFADAIPYHLDFIIFDACFMGSIEVCYELKDKTDYIVASPAEVLVPGFMYATMMQHLFAPVPDLTAVAREFYEYYNRQTGFYRSATVSVVKTAGLENLATVVKDATQPDALSNNLENIQTYGYGAQKIYFDMEDYLQKLSPEKYNEFQIALSQCVMYKSHTPEYFSVGTNTMHVINTFGGLSVYLPNSAYPKANEAYMKLKWAKRTIANIF